MCKPTLYVQNRQFSKNDHYKIYQSRIKKGLSLKMSSYIYRIGGSRTAATSKMEHFVIIVNGWKPLTIITKSSILDVAAVLDPLLYR